MQVVELWILKRKRKFAFGHKKEDCEELAKDIEVQKEACKSIIHQKEELIK